MALDAGRMSSDYEPGGLAGGSDLYSYSIAGPASPSLEAIAFAPGVPLGAGFKAAREALRLTLDQVAEATKIRSSYLASLEAMDLTKLPSRPFTLGYVRAYAQVLGLDEERALARFKQDAPDKAEPLRAPIGVPKTYDPRFGMLAIATSVVVAAIVIWNVAQRAMAKHDPHPTREVVATAPVPEAAPGPVKLGAALPPPQESTVPDPYITPGLFGPTEQPAEVPAKTGPLKPATELRRFVPKGAVFGAAADQSQLIIQAQRSGSLIARAGDGKVYFAQQLKAGEAYRAPNLPGLLIDVSAPDAMHVFAGGVWVGNLVEPVTPLTSIIKAVPAPPPSAAPAPVATTPAATPSPAAAPVSSPGLAPTR